MIYQFQRKDERGKLTLDKNSEHHTNKMECSYSC